jgi:hypothetical protein
MPKTEAAVQSVISQFTNQATSAPKHLHVTNWACFKHSSCYSCLSPWGETVSLDCGNQQAYCSSLRWYMSMKSHGGIIVIWDNRRTREKNLSQWHCPLQIPHTIEPGAKPGLRRERPATNSLRHGTVLMTQNIPLRRNCSSRTLKSHASCRRAQQIVNMIHYSDTKWTNTVPSAVTHVLSPRRR